ncbi:MAG: LLM class flavin-dependent oxidoreductase [Rhodobacteraceae bacterium]|nr:LLM class flavin-dependent oxidoreductase [Paracoccaceae bacterium]
MNQKTPKPFSCIVIGNESLMMQCCDAMLQRGHDVQAVVTDRTDIIDWASSKGLRTIASGNGLADRLKGLSFDWLFSIANLKVLPDTVLAQAGKGAINFHDGPLPHYAGLNTPAWAVINREQHYGISWHMISGGIDEGDILEHRVFDVSPEDTALTLNTKCFEAAIESFDPLLRSVESGDFQRVPQNLSGRRYFAKSDRPAAAARLDFNRPAEELVALVRGLDHGAYWNPLSCPKIAVGDQVFLVGEADLEEDTEAAAGTVISASTEKLVVATGTTAISLQGLTDDSGHSVDCGSVASEGERLEVLSTQEADRVTDQMSEVVGSEGYWRKHLQELVPASLHFTNNVQRQPGYASHDFKRPATLAIDTCATGVACWVSRITGSLEIDLAYSTSAADKMYLSDWVPVRFDATGENDCASFEEAGARFSDALKQARKHGAFARDLGVRDARIDLSKTPDVAVSLAKDGGPVTGSCITVAVPDGKLYYDTNRISAGEISSIAGQLEHLLTAIAEGSVDGVPVHHLPILSGAERDLVLFGWNDTKTVYDTNACVHQLFEAQVARKPDATALVFEASSLTYGELNERANRTAHVLREMGVEPGVVVGLLAQRSVELVIGALAIQKAGGAYLPLDPTYPKNRLVQFVEDSAARVIVAQSGLVAELPDHQAEVLEIDRDARIGAAPDTNVDSGVTSADLAYLIYTSGSTGVPKGVMVEHRNVANFFAGMDERVTSDANGVWLAVTSLSFDISVLELFYTLARGYKVVVNSDESRMMASNAPIISDQKMAFSLYNWGNDDAIGTDKYELMLEGAKFADKNGFCAVWTPERHFHAFGGSYPNPAVTGAAIAAITQNLAVRAGSIVAPLHHPIRIAEDWAVIDNLTQGRVGLGMASGWHPNDFVLCPENSPPNNKPAMFEAIKTVRKLWAGEAVDFPNQEGKPVAVLTQPRPISENIPVWVTIAGNPETWREAGEAGANVLTHLLGQSIAEVEEKTVIYHDALRAAGYDPRDFTVTLMLHTYVAEDREIARETARDAMKNYMRSAAGLIKQFAWSFPAFKRPTGVNNPFQLDLEILTPGELEAILDFAFERYFEDSGLFGTVEDCLARVEQLKKIGVGEVACLVDYGLPMETVLEGLVPLAEVLKRANVATEPAEDDFSIAAQITRHKVTHLQCTPSMARMLVSDDHAGVALGSVKHLLIGGEPLPGSLVADLSARTSATLENMYGPTETTIWSSSETVGETDGLVNIGTPIANTQLYVLDASQEPVPVGVPGELYIAGAGVARGYWQRPELTAERFLSDRFADDGGMMYRTGDLACWRPDGKISFLGRVDNQIKLRGHRIELGEIEACLEAHADVQQAVVVTREMAPGDTRLVAYVVANPAVPEAELRDKLAASLPDYMVPAHYVSVDEIPLTPNKKIDRKALPTPSAKPAATAVDYVLPDTTVERKIASIWSGVLGVGNIGAGDSFFDLGGHSLLAVLAHREIVAELDVERLRVTDVFRFPKLSDLAGRVVELLNPETEATAEPGLQTEQDAQSRTDAMSRRRAMRAQRRVSS